MEKNQDGELMSLQALALSHKLKSKSCQKHFTDDQKRMIAEAYLLNHVPLTQLSKEFNVSRITIWRWISSFACENGSKEKIRQADPVRTNSLPMPKKEKSPIETPEEELARLRQENRRLEEALKMSEWMNHAKDVMIDEAEKTFNIPIRKKSGAKQ